AKFDGVWILESLEDNGEPRAFGAVPKYQFAEGANTDFPNNKPGKFVVDTTKIPKTIDIITVDRTYQGIYELDGDKLQICTNDHQQVVKDGKKVLEPTARPTK